MRLTAMQCLLPILIGLVPLPVQAQDEPDPYFVDENADGIDGVLANAVFVAPPPTGIDGAGRGLTPGDPVATIGFGVSQAMANARTQVLVQVGTYNESLFVASGISIHGGYGSGFVRVPSTATTATVINGGATAVQFINVGLPTTLSFLTIRSANVAAPGDSSYAVRLHTNTGALTFKFNRFEPGSGGPGIDGDNGSPGSGQMTLPQPGVNAEETSGPVKPGGAGGTSICGQTGGKGGNGGGGSTIAAQPGEAGSGGATGGPAGANSSSSMSNGGNGGSGGLGLDGSDGAHGAASAVSVGALNASGLYFPPTAPTGTAGTDGASGAGGGGGGGQDCMFGCVRDVGASGGGGGAGGCAGGGGAGGGGGGGSFGIAIGNSANVELSMNLFAPSLAGGGGDGGDGGTRGFGGDGRSGGLQNGTDGGNGGGGGNGGDSGVGGSGAGGNGGPAIGIYDPSDTVYFDTNRYVPAGAAALPGANGAGSSVAPLSGLRRLKHPTNAAAVGTPAASVGDIVAIEPVAGSANTLFTVTLSTVREEIITIDYTFTAVGGATAGSDFDATPGSVSFNPWTTVATIAVPILADAESEAAEQFELVLTSPGLGGLFTVADGTGVATIVPAALFANGFE